MRYEVFGLAGLGYPFTAGGIKNLDRLIDALPAKTEAQSYAYWDADAIADGIIFRANKFKDGPVICLFAHSWGVKTGLELCAKLGKNNVEVAYFAAIDPTALRVSDSPMTVPTNVRQLDEFWSDKWRLVNFPYMARQAAPTGKRGGLVRNPHKVPHYLDPNVPAGHSATAWHPRVVTRIVSQIEQRIA